MPPKKKVYNEAAEQAKRRSLIFKFLTLKGEKETDMGKLNLAKLDHSMRTMLRDVKVEDLYKEIEILSQAFERIVDRKDNVIRGLKESIRLAEEQHRIALAGHLEQIEQFIQIQKDRLGVSQRDFDENITDMNDDFSNQTNQMTKTHINDMDNMADLSFALESLYSGAENEYKSEFRSRVDEIRNRNSDERQYMRLQLEHQMEQTWQQMQATLQEYNESTEDRQRGYYNLLEKDEKNGRLINLQMDQIQNTAEIIANLKEKMAGMLEQHQRKTGSLAEDRELMKKHFQELKTRLKKVDQHHKDCLLRLATVTNKVITQLQTRVDEAEKIIRLGEMSSKFETVEEKIVPFYPSSYSDAELEELKNLENEPFQEPLAALVGDYKGLDNFWKRYNKVYLDKLCLEKEQAVLVTENARLCHMLRKYLGNITVQEDTVNHPENTLLMINTEIKLHFQTVPTTDARVTRAHTAIVDAGHVFQQQYHYKVLS